MRPMSATMVCLGVLLFVCAAPVAAQDSIYVCAGPKGQLKMVDSLDDCHKHDVPLTLQTGGGGGGGEPAEPLNYAWVFSQAGMSEIGAVCTNQLAIEVPIPPNTPAGMLTVTGKHRVVLDHTSVSPGDRGIVGWSGITANCTAPDTDRSHFGVSEFDFATAHETTVFTQRSFASPAGGVAGVILKLYLNSIMTSGNTPIADVIGEHYAVVEFHVTTP